MLVTKRARVDGTCHSSKSVFREYYAEWFPVGAMTAWVTCDVPGEELADTEFCLFGENRRVIERHLRTADANTLREDLANSTCTRVEIGSTRTRMDTETRRLVYDLDMDDYHGVYPGEALPTKETGLDALAWEVARLSTRLLDVHLALVMCRPSTAPRTLAVFSGRRGIHLWVMGARVDWLTHDIVQQHLDALAELHTSQGAKDFVTVLEHFSHDADVDQRYHLRELRAALGVYARNSLCEVYLWENAGKAGARRDLFSCVLECHPRRSELTVYSDASVDVAEFFCGLRAAGDETPAVFWERAAILLLAPRPDAPVSLQETHLVKAPFSLHPATRNVSLPFLPHAPESANFASVQVRADRLLAGHDEETRRFAQGVACCIATTQS